LLSDAIRLTNMIKSWKHKGLKRFFETENKSGVIASQEKRLKIILQRLNAASKAEDMSTRSMNFHSLTGNLNGYYAVTVSKNWRIIFRFDGTDAIDVDYLDYH
jgi:proteic killer suppression protein